MELVAIHYFFRVTYPTMSNNTE